MKKVFESGIAPLCDAADRFPWHDRGAYSQYLAQTYYYLIHSTRLLGLGAARFSDAEETLHRRFLDHAREEKGHHLLALKDLENMGYKLEQFLEMPVTRLVYEPQYYKIEHLDPTALFGYILALEGIAVLRCSKVAAKVDKLHGKASASFLRVHGEDDPDHLDKAFDQVGILNSRRLKYIEDGFMQSCSALTLFFDEIAAQVGQNTLRKAA